MLVILYSQVMLSQQQCSIQTQYVTINNYVLLRFTISIFILVLYIILKIIIKKIILSFGKIAYMVKLFEDITDEQRKKIVLYT